MSNGTSINNCLSQLRIKRANFILNFCLKIWWCHLASRAFFLLARFWCTWEEFCINQVHVRAMTIGLQVNGCSHSKKPFWERKQDWLVWSDSDRASFFPPHSRRRRCLQDAVIYMSQTKSSPYLQLHVNLKDMLKDPRPVIRIK